MLLMAPIEAESLTGQSPVQHDPSIRLLEDKGESRFLARPTAPQKASEPVRAYVTGYNTVPEQTDDTPCIARDGSNICGRDDVAACPRSYPLGSWVLIGGRAYECVDRTAKKHDGRFDISCDKDMKCPARITGWYDVRLQD